jgi:hypothetical protein
MTIRRIAATLLSLYVMLHAGLLIYDFHHPDVWLKADRANERIDHIREFPQTSGVWAQLDYIGRHGAPGDYLIQVTVYDLGGFASMLLAQVTLCIVSVVCVYRMARTVLGGGRLPLLVACLYALLPQTLIFPHQLSAEAWFVPLVVFGFYCMTRWFDTRAPRPAFLSGLYFAGATLTRATVLPFALLFPLVLRRGKSANSRAPYYLALVIPVFAWVTMVHTYTGKWSLGEGTSASVGNNLMFKARFIADTFPPEAREKAQQRYIAPALNRDGLLTVTEYARFCADYLGPCTSQVAQDALNFFFKSGIERLTLDYLGLLPEKERIETQRARPGSSRGWAQEVRSRGALAAAEFYLAKYPLVVGASLLAALAFGLVTLIYAAGTVDALIGLLKHAVEDRRRLVLALLAIFPPYLFAASSVVSSMQSRHRAAAEFAILIVAGNGWRVCRRWIERRNYRGSGERAAPATAAAGSFDPIDRAMMPSRTANQSVAKAKMPIAGTNGNGCPSAAWADFRGERDAVEHFTLAAGAQRTLC